MAIIRLSEGQYAIRWRDSRGKRHYERIPEKTPYKQVVKIHAAKVADCGEKTAPNTATVARVCRDYIELHDVHAKRPFTELGRARAEGIARQIEQDPLGAILVGESKPKHFLQWRLRRKASVSDATLDRERNFVRAALNLATTTEEIVANPVKRGAIKRLVSSTEGKVIYFEPAEWRAFISALDDEKRWRAHVGRTQRKGVVKIGSVVDTPRSYAAGRNADSDATREYRDRLLRLRPYFAALLWTGSRLSEIRMLTWADVDDGRRAARRHRNIAARNRQCTRLHSG